MKPVMNGSTDFTVPFSLRDTTAMSPPNFLDRFHEPWRATKMALRYSDGNMLPVENGMPSGAECGPNNVAGFVNSSHERPQPNSWSGMLPWWQYGYPKLSLPGWVSRLSLSSGISSESQSRLFSVK